MKKRTNLSSIGEICLDHLGVKSTSEINDWFNNSYDGKYIIPGMDQFKEIVNRHKQSPIRIMGDYDVDGVSATFIMYKALTEYGCEDVSYRTPKRFSEGFGLSKQMIDEVPEGSLIITVDNGIAAVDTVDYAKKRGCTVIITDHHEPVVENGRIVFPKADLIIDPKAGMPGYTYDGYCGAGIAYKIAVSLIGEKKGQQFLPLTAIATVADVMELREENYVFVRNGLRIMPDTKNPGLKALLNRLGLNDHISETDIGFKIAPALNAPGRLLDHGSMLSVQLLLAPNQNIGKSLSDKVYTLNEERKHQVSLAMKSANESLIEAENLINVVYVPEINEGVIGIVAGKLCESTKRPAIVLTDGTEKDILKGSARAPENISIKQILDQAASEIIRHGGHAGAAGLSIEKSKLESFKKAVNDSAAASGYKPTEEDETSFDIEISEEDITRSLEEVEKYLPFGQGNEPVLVKVNNFHVIPRNKVYKALAGVDGIKLLGADATAIGFEMAEKMADVEKPTVINLVGTLSTHYFMGKKSAQIDFIDYEVVEKADDEANTPFKDAIATMAAMRK